MSEHESHGQSFMHPINSPCRYLCVLKHLCLKYRNQGHLPLFLKEVCCAKIVGSLRSEFCHDPRNQGGQERGEHQQHTYRAEIQGEATLYVLHNKRHRIGSTAGPIHWFTTGPKAKHIVQEAGNHCCCCYVRELAFCITSSRYTHTWSNISVL